MIGEGRPKQNWRKGLLAYTPLFVWVIVILGLGSGIGSMEETSRFVRPLLHFLFPSASEETYVLYHAIIRKCAHVFEYSVLSFLAYRAFSLTLRPIFLTFPASLSVVLVIASIDEFRQSFLESRTSSTYDVLLDVISAALTLFIIWTFVRVQRTSQANPPV